jgi:hypothetical protein
VLVAVATGLYARFDDLGGRPLALDEYYFARPVEAIAETGLPGLPSGGYYPRGILPQYLTAASVLLLDDREFALRLPAALFSLAAVVLAFLFARRFVGTALGAAVAAALLLSSWHVEFARFARMYGAFQCATLVFLLALHRSWVAAAPWKGRYAPHAVLLVAALCHEMALFLCPLLFVPFLSRVRRGDWARGGGWTYAAVSAVAILVVITWTHLDGYFWTLGVTDRYPDGYVPAGTPTFWFPQQPVWSVGRGGVVDLLILVAPMVLAAIWFASRGALQARPDRRDLLLSWILIAVGFHQFALAMLFAAALLWRFRVDELFRGRAAFLLATSGLIALGWILFASLSTGWMQDLWKPRAFETVFLGFPNFFHLTLRPWSRAMPLLGMTLLAALIVTFVARRRWAWNDLAGATPALFAAYVVACFSVFRAEFSTLRYSYFMYPVLLTVLAMAVSDVTAFLRRWWSVRVVRLTSPAVFAALFFVGEDFNARHLADVAGPAASFRMGPFARFWLDPWVTRVDIRSPAQYVSAVIQAEGPAPIVVAYLPHVAYYLRESHGIYLFPGATLFSSHSRNKGTLDLWSGQRLLQTLDAVRDFVGPSRVVWLIRRVEDFRNFSPVEIWGESVRAQRRFLGQDRYIEVVRVEITRTQG